MSGPTRAHPQPTQQSTLTIIMLLYRVNHHQTATVTISRLLKWKILIIRWQHRIKKRLGIRINIMQRMMQTKLNFFGHICRTTVTGWLSKLFST